MEERFQTLSRFQGIETALPLIQCQGYQVSKSLPTTESIPVPRVVSAFIGEHPQTTYIKCGIYLVDESTKYRVARHEQTVTYDVESDREGVAEAYLTNGCFCCCF